MNETERLILENQVKIMQVVRGLSNDEYWKDELESQIDETTEALAPKEDDGLAEQRDIDLEDKN